MADRIISFEKPREEWILSAHKACDDHEWLRAVRMYRKALAMEESAGTRLEMAYVYFNMRCYDTALRHLKNTLVEGQMPAIEQVFLMCMCFFNMGELRLAAESEKLFRALHTAHAPFARDAFKNPLPYDCPRFVPARARRAYFQLEYIDELDRAEALDAAETAMETDPTGRSALEAARFSMLKETEDALDLLDMAMSLGIPQMDVRKMYTVHFMGQELSGQDESAENSFDLASDACCTMKDVEQLVDAALEVNRADLAEDLLDAYIEAFPDSTGYHAMQEKTLLQQGLEDEARVQRSAIYGADPEWTDESLLPFYEALLHACEPFYLQSAWGEMTEALAKDCDDAAFVRRELTALSNLLPASLLKRLTRKNAKGAYNKTHLAALRIFLKTRKGEHVNAEENLAGLTNAFAVLRLAKRLNTLVIKEQMEKTVEDIR